MINIRTSTAVAFLALSPALSLAQDAPSVRKNAFEVGGFIGANFAKSAEGATFDRFRAMGGGNVTYSVLTWLLPYAEYGYFPELSGSFKPDAETTVDYKNKVHDLHFGVHMRKTIPRIQLVPYAVLGYGGLRVTSSGLQLLEYLDRNTGQMVTERIPLSAQSQWISAFNYGAGLRYYVGENWGIRGELKLYKPFSDNDRFNRFFGKAEFGVFYQSGTR